MQAGRVTPYALVVEDHPLIADSLEACIRDCAPEMDVETAESLRGALEILGLRPAPMLIVTDLTLTDTEGVAGVRRLREMAPGSPLIVFTALDTPALRKEADALGAARYIVKSASKGTLRDEMRAILGACPDAPDSPQSPADTVRSLLSPKQIAVLEELAAGRSNKEIAARLDISYETVGSHMKEILGRLSARNRTEAVVRYLKILHPGRDRQGH